MNKRLEITLKNGEVVNLMVNDYETVRKTTDVVSEYDEDDKRVTTRHLIVKAGCEDLVCADKKEQTAVYNKIVKCLDDLVAKKEDGDEEKYNKREAQEIALVERLTETSEAVQKFLEAYTQLAGEFLPVVKAYGPLMKKLLDPEG
jgi:hypothetical protein